MIGTLLAGMCAVTVYVSPSADTVYGPEIREALGVISAASGVQFRQDPLDGDLDLFAANVSAAGPEAAGYYWEDQIVLTPEPSKYYYEYQTPRMQHNFRLRLVVHELMHFFGAGHSEDTRSVTYRYAGDNRVRLSAGDVSFLDSLECK